MTIENLLVVHAWTGGLSYSPGSVTLRQWQQLATPKIEGLFESRPGVATRGDRKLDVEVENYNISDFEEDGETFYNTIPTELFLHNKDFLNEWNCIQNCDSHNLLGFSFYFCGKAKAKAAFNDFFPFLSMMISFNTGK